jgi:hypothetical protein
VVPLPLLRDEPIMIQGKPLDLPLEPIELLKPLDQLMTARVFLMIFYVRYFIDNCIFYGNKLFSVFCYFQHGTRNHPRQT